MPQNKVSQFMAECPQPMNVQTCVNDIIAELGEVTKEVNIANSWSRYVDYDFRDNFRTELGQLLFTVYQLAEVTNVDVEAELEKVIEDFRERYARQGHTGSSTYLSGDQT